MTGERWGMVHEIVSDPEASPVEVAWRLWQRMHASALTPTIDLAAVDLFGTAVGDDAVSGAVLQLVARDRLLSIEAVAGCAGYFPRGWAPNAGVIIGTALWWCGAPSAAVQILSAVLDQWPHLLSAQMTLTLIAAGTDAVEARAMLARYEDPSNS